VSKKESLKPAQAPRSKSSSSVAPVDDRVRRSKESVLRATVELLTETGLGGLSVDEVARRSGVAKTTIYRHWPTRSDLVIDACSRITTELDVPDTGSFEGNITSLLTSIAKLLRTARWSSILPSIIAAAEHSCPLVRVVAPQKASRAPLGGRRAAFGRFDAPTACWSASRCGTPASPRSSSSSSTSSPNRAWSSASTPTPATATCSTARTRRPP
jgi:Bacterial regulatory proteins, tetR family